VKPLQPLQVILLLVPYTVLPEFLVLVQCSKVLVIIVEAGAPN